MLTVRRHFYTEINPNALKLRIKQYKLQKSSLALEFWGVMLLMSKIVTMSQTRNIAKGK